MIKRSRGFTLIELLVVISIIGILLGLSIFGLQGARQSSRDAKRKADLELIRSGLEIYKADCNGYPASLGTSLKGSGATSSCALTNTYISQVPLDPISPASDYAFLSDGVTYILCAALEQAPSPAVDTTGCGSCTTACNYKVANP
jgi:general secretion pathway protein G